MDAFYNKYSANDSINSFDSTGKSFHFKKHFKHWTIIRNFVRAVQIIILFASLEANAQCTKKIITDRFSNSSFDVEKAEAYTNHKYIKMSDEGRGLPSSLCSIIFNAFTKLDSTPFRNTKYFFVNNLKLRNIEVSGIITRDIIIIAYYAHDADSLEEFEKVIYHETSSIFYQSSPLKYNWDTLYFQQMQSGKCQFNDEDWYFKHPSESFSRAEKFKKCGIVLGYGASNAENDFNTYAEFYYVNPGYLEKVSKNNDFIKAKFSLFKTIIQQQ